MEAVVTMRTRSRQSLSRMRGYSLIELLTVLFIVGVLCMAGGVYLQGRTTSSVRSVMDELEGALINAQKATLLMSRDVYVSTTGKWMDGTLMLDGRPFSATVPDPPLASHLTPGDTTNRQGSTSECFRSLFPKSRDHRSAAVLTKAQEAWYTTARGTTADLATVEPIASQPDLKEALGNRLFTGAARSIVINGQSKRFEEGFSVVVVGLVGDGPQVNGAVGVLVVPANGVTVYKFYKPDGDKSWRRL